MIVLCIGTPGSGKSKFAENKAEELSDNKSKIYIATMEPYGQEGYERVKRHRHMREGKQFITIEKYTDLCEIYEEISAYKPGCCLVECVTNLVGNEMHSKKNMRVGADDLADKIVNDLLGISRLSDNMVIVTNEFDNIYDDPDTLNYVNLLHDVNERLKVVSDEVYVMPYKEKVK